MMNDEQLREKIEVLFDSECRYDEDGGHNRPGHHYTEKWFCEDCFAVALFALIHEERREAVERTLDCVDDEFNGRDSFFLDEDDRERVLLKLLPPAT